MDRLWPSLYTDHTASEARSAAGAKADQVQPVRQLSGAPSNARRGSAASRSPGVQAQRAVPQGRRHRHGAQQKKSAAPVNGNDAFDAWSSDQSDAGATIA